MNQIEIVLARVIWHHFAHIEYKHDYPQIHLGSKKNDILLIRYQFRNYLTIIETNLETNFFLVSNLITITTNYFYFLKIDFYFMIFL